MTTIPVRPLLTVPRRSPAPSRSLKSLLTLFIFLTTLGQQAVAQSSADKAATFDIPAQSLETALIEFSKQANVQVMAAGEVLEGHMTQPLKGTLGTRVALATLLNDTGLEASFAAADNTVMVRRKEGIAVVDPDDGGPSSDESPKSTTGSDQINRADKRTNSNDEDPEKGKLEKQPLEEVIVTGTHIRGSAPVGSPLLSLDREAIESNGFATTQDVVRSLPQNFGGGPSEDTRLGNEALFNASSAVGVNLRALGAGSTLVLVNGRRLAPSGSEGRFVDVSAVPLSAIERIEVLADGASAIYGADAIGGVVNFIMREDYGGAETRGRYGGVTEGSGASELQFGQIFGTRWASGNGLVSLEYYERDSLIAAERRQAASSDLRPLGGSNFDFQNGNPGTIRIGTQTWAIPRGQDGQSLTPASFTPGTVNLHNRNIGRDWLPDHERWSVWGTARQALTERVELFADALFTSRDTESHGPHESMTLTVPDTNAFYVNPTGGTGPVRVVYNFTRDLGPMVFTNDVETSSFALGSKIKAADTWRVNTYVGYSREKQINRTLNRVNPTVLVSALADSNRATALNAFGDGSFTNPATLDALDNADTLQDRSVELWMGNVVADGTLLSAFGRDLKVALGAEYRHQTLDSSARVIDTFFPTVGQERDLEAGFAELRLPLFGGDTHRPGLQRLELSLAARYERYSDFGTKTTPKLGLEWSPVQGVSLRGSWSDAFKAPALIDLDESLNGSVIIPLPDPQSASGSSNVLIWFGRNADLSEETATTWSLGADFAPAALPQLSFGLTYFNVEFEDRVEEVPFTTSFLQDPRLAAFVTRNPDAASRERVCSRSPFLTPPACRTAPIDAIVDVRLSNVAVTETSGIDLLGSYAIKSDRGEFGFSLNATYLLEFEQARQINSPLMDLLNTQNNPIDLRMRGSLSWSRGGFGITTFINYTDSYRDTFSEPDRKVEDWTTVDLQLSYGTGADRESMFENTTVSLNVQNAFDEDAPFLNNPRGVGYDEENADVLGRFLSLQIRKEW